MSTITQTFNPSIGEYGQDYAVPVGTPIYSPVSGIFSSVDNGKKAWGKQAFVHMATAIGGVATFAVGHLTAFAAQPGQKVTAGQLIGYSGGAVTDPSSGVSTGPHVEPQFYNAAGHPINPTGVFAQFKSWEQAIFTGKGGASSSSSASAPATGSGDPLAALAALTGIPEAIGAATTGVIAVATRAFFLLFGFALFVFGVVIIFKGDIEHAVESGQQAVGKAGEIAAGAAEVAA